MTNTVINSIRQEGRGGEEEEEEEQDEEKEEKEVEVEGKAWTQTQKGKYHHKFYVSMFDMNPSGVWPQSFLSWCFREDSGMDVRAEEDRGAEVDTVFLNC